MELPIIKRVSEMQNEIKVAKVKEKLSPVEKQNGKLKLGIIGLTEEQKIVANRDLIIHDLVLEYLGFRFGMEEEETLWTCFKKKLPIVDKDGKEWYIHSVQSYVEWETNVVQTRYVCRENRDNLEGTQVVFQQNQLRPKEGDDE